MRTLYVVRTNAVPGREAEFDRWYDEIHLAEVLAIPGFLSAQRFRLAAAQVQPTQTHGYLALYEIDGDDVDATLDRVRAATHLRMSDAMDPTTIDVSVFEPVAAPRVSA